MMDKSQPNNNEYLKIYFVKKLSSSDFSEDTLPQTNHTILFVVSGYTDIYINNVSRTLLLHDFILIHNSISFKILRLETNSKLYIISYSEHFLDDNIIRYNLHFYFLTRYDYIIIHINPEDIPFLKRIFKLIHTAQVSNNNQFLKLLFSIGFDFLLQKVIDMPSVNTPKFSQQYKIVLAFFSLLEQNFKKEHTVKFYANTLCVTPGHLNKKVKGLTSKTTKQFIDLKVILYAKELLKNNNLLISEIAEQLNFSNINSFSNYFKRYTSLSPTEYRNNIFR